jgi:hypothetical protein
VGYVAIKNRICGGIAKLEVPQGWRIIRIEKMIPTLPHYGPMYG